ncbi:protein arginine N-methyltransferase 1.6 isoform X2 [Ricinus communis]|uniref:protein arginine N-methyltransferase 1.6 isoform X2 n=1 Tax=Ricinus communis TaxID=3988 RepID=UPI000D68F26D|nr:protein arginine N-methyltransferase 1.6 isoform X2 [Ricinus communis]|eukprot:XP_025014847.1 protein arginine N-methyltransferase 1.6 isoform X2 [Ricinus communis]
MNSLISKTLKQHLARLSLLSQNSLSSTLTRTMSTESIRKQMFQLKLDPLTGKSEWIIITENEEEETFGNPNRNLLATTSYLDMLNDSARNRAFREAIDKVITKPCHVLDIGAGTGLLSMMAARAMRSGEESRGTVTACESYLPMVKMMRKVLHVNGMGRTINVFNKRSDELKVGVDIPSRADVLVSEILDSELLGEGLIPSLQHAHDMLLVDNPLTVPYRATTYGQLVESTFLWKLHDLYDNEAKASDNIRLVPTGLDTILRVKLQQNPMNCDAISKEIKLLSEPFKIFEFDFWKRPDSHGETEVLIKATNDGTVHAVISWWMLQLDCEGTIFYSTAPKWIGSPTNIGTSNWCDHWKQCTWFLPGKGIQVGKGEQLLLHATHTDTNVFYNIEIQDTEVRQHNFTAGDFHLILPPERLAIYGDSEWRSSMLTALRNALQEKVQPLCIVADDSLFATLALAHLSKTAHVISLFPGLREKGSQYLQTVADANDFKTDRVNVFLNNKCLTLQDTNQKKVDLLIGEPYYYGNDGMLPWQYLRFWKTRTMLDSILSNDILIMPCKARLKACAMSLPDLWNSRCSLSKIEGFDHSVVNTTIGACGDVSPPHEGPLVPVFLWQSGEELSERFTVMEFEFSKLISPCYGKIQVKFTEPGMCHGFALWIDWVMDAKHSVVLSAGPDHRYWKQGVKLLAHPVLVAGPESTGGDCCSAVIEASFDASNGELTINHAFS